MYIELSNGVKQRRFPLSVSTDNDDFSRSSSRGGGIYSSIDSNATSEELNSVIRSSKCVFGCYFETCSACFCAWKNVQKIEAGKLHDTLLLYQVAIFTLCHWNPV